jgi:hypothetical protein
VELHRVFPPLPHEAAHDAVADVPRGGNDAAEARELRARLDAAQEAIRFRDEVIADLRQQRDRVQEQLTAALLTDQRPRRSWLRRVFSAGVVFAAVMSAGVGARADGGFVSGNTVPPYSGYTNTGISV